MFWFKRYFRGRFLKIRQHYYKPTFVYFDAFLFKQFPEFLNFFFEFSDEFSVSVFIDHGLAYDLLGSISITIIMA